ncbi:hypothetical protein OB236_13950 [Paenibacillus sp. WQ 127069]|uniref:Uncharacterized protein n=1 Tax=Paenibacillus baimaensis TaxID=2982185 RepID=A0ABT2UGF6_9BACL|nr:hypothetical protein [Paenibacillus sp. WQ 127069]MCU6793221.1 hypothetical protein [Paenibacillus sp. WQ 127069]
MDSYKKLNKTVNVGGEGEKLLQGLTLISDVVTNKTIEYAKERFQRYYVIFNSLIAIQSYHDHDYYDSGSINIFIGADLNVDLNGKTISLNGFKFIDYYR